MRSVPYFKSWKQYWLKYWWGCGGTFHLQSNKPMNFSPLSLFAENWHRRRGRGPGSTKWGRDQYYTALRSLVAMGLYGGTTKLLMVPCWCQSRGDEPCSGWSLWSNSVLFPAVRLAVLCYVKKTKFPAPWDNIITSAHIPKKVWSWAFFLSLMKENGKPPEDLCWTETNLPGSLPHALYLPFWFEE